MTLKSFLLIVITAFSTTALAATQAEIAKWTEETLVNGAQATVVRPGEAKIVSAYRLMLNGDDRKVPGQIYWDVDCYNSDGVKLLCTTTLKTVNVIGEDGFGRYTSKSCYVGNAKKVCDLIKLEAARTSLVRGHGMFRKVECSISEKDVNVTYETDNDYEGTAKAEMKIGSCL